MRGSNCSNKHLSHNRVLMRRFLSVFLGKKKRACNGRHIWTEEQVDELRNAFAFVVKKKKLPKVGDLPSYLDECPVVKRYYDKDRLTISAIKNKIDRIFRITLK